MGAMAADCCEVVVIVEVVGAGCGERVCRRRRRTPVLYRAGRRKRACRRSLSPLAPVVPVSAHALPNRVPRGGSPPMATRAVPPSVRRSVAAALLPSGSAFTEGRESWERRARRLHITAQHLPKQQSRSSLRPCLPTLLLSLPSSLLLPDDSWWVSQVADPTG